MLLVGVAHAEDSFSYGSLIKRFVKNEKHEKYLVYYDHEGSMSGDCAFGVSTKNYYFNCFASYEHVNCDTIIRPDSSRSNFDAIHAEIENVILKSTFKDKQKLGICGINGFGYVSNKYSIGCKYTEIVCDTCKYEKYFHSNSCKDSEKKKMTMNTIKKMHSKM